MIIFVVIWVLSNFVFYGRVEFVVIFVYVLCVFGKGGSFYRIIKIWKNIGNIKVGIENSVYSYLDIFCVFVDYWNFF